MYCKNWLFRTPAAKVSDRADVSILIQFLIGWRRAGRSTMGIKWSEFSAFQGGVMGVRLPRSQISPGAEPRTDLPYFDPR
jgi:hypothetical protein